MTMLPAKYAWLNKEGGPRMLNAMLGIYGTVETPGKEDSPIILGWAQELGIRKVYSDDAIPWCGLGMAIVAQRAGYVPPKGFLAALSWRSWGVGQTVAMLGDVLVKKRKGGGHVTQYIAEDTTHYHCMGCNQSDSVNITRIPKSVFVAIRRAPFKVGQPSNIRRILVSAAGTPVAGNEA